MANSSNIAFCKTIYLYRELDPTLVNAMYPYQKRSVVKAADRWSDDASDSLLSRWALGVGCAAVPVVIGAMTILSKHAYFLGGKPIRVVEYHNTNAMLIGAGAIALGVFVHGHYFWSSSRRFYFLSELLKPLGLLAVVGCALGLLVNEIVFG